MQIWSWRGRRPPPRTLGWRTAARNRSLLPDEDGQKRSIPDTGGGVAYETGHVHYEGGRVHRNHVGVRDAVRTRFAGGLKDYLIRRDAGRELAGERYIGAPGTASVHGAGSGDLGAAEAQHRRSVQVDLGIRDGLAVLRWPGGGRVN